MTSLDSYGYTLVTGRLSWRLQILPVHCLTLQYGYSSSPVHQGSKSGEADGSCRRHQYSPVYRRLANENNSKNRIVGLQFDLRVGLVFPTQRKSIVFWQGQLPCWKLLVYLQGSSCHFESMASMENTIPLGYLNMKALQWYLETLLISSVSGCPISWVFWFRDHLQWWTSSSILKEYSPLQEHSFLSIHRSFPNGLGCFLSRPQPLVCGIRKSQDSTLHNIGSNVVIFKK